MKKRVLIVDDEFGLVDVIAEMLTARGHDVALAINGRLALENLALQRADVVLLDVMMPVMDGPSTLQAMRADPRLANVPVILMTALPEAIPDWAKPLAQKVLIKPFTPDTLFSALDQLLGS